VIAPACRAASAAEHGPRVAGLPTLTASASVETVLVATPPAGI
jgi:hypothetical protein